MSLGRPAAGAVISGREVGALWVGPETSNLHDALGSVPYQPLSLCQDLPIVPSRSFHSPELKSHYDSVQGVTQFLLETGKKSSCGSI